MLVRHLNGRGLRKAQRNQAVAGHRDDGANTLQFLPLSITEIRISNFVTAPSEINALGFARGAPQPYKVAMSRSERHKFANNDAVVGNAEHGSPRFGSIGWHNEQRMRESYAKASHCGGVPGTMRANCVSEVDSAILVSPVVSVPVIVHHPGIDTRGRGDVCDPPGICGRDVAWHNRGDSAHLNQWSIASGPRYTIFLIRDVHPVLNRVPVHTRCR